ncbi:DUF222 domain-containing protein [Actinopolymorpha alba]|uniref:DUF222 domain-containing protein n=1 Tax=Actinopolymorpha alba TaxID=533267 RepID=UPI003B50C28F
MFDHGDVDVSALAEAAPGPELAATLAAIDLNAVNGYARVVVMQAWQRQASWASCRMYEAMFYVARSPMGGEDAPPELLDTCSEFASVEIGAALTLAPGSADRELCLALDLTARLPGTRAALEAGRIDVNKAREIASEPASCPMSLPAGGGVDPVEGAGPDPAADRAPVEGECGGAGSGGCRGAAEGSETRASHQVQCRCERGREYLRL